MDRIITGELTLARLNELLIDDIAQSLGVKPAGLLHRLIKLLIWKPGLKFCKVLRDADRQLAHESLKTIAERTLSIFARGYRLLPGSQPVATEGPLLVVANHAGAGDFLAAAACINRQDLHIIAGRRPVLESFKNLSQFVIFLNRDPSARMAVMRQVIEILERGKSVLLFPRGFLEPDPALMQAEAIESVERWSESVGIFLKKAPSTYLQPLIIRHVLSPALWKSPLPRLGRTCKQKLQIAMILQMALPFFGSIIRYKMTPQLMVGAALPATHFSSSFNAREINTAVQENIRNLIEQLPEN